MALTYDALMQCKAEGLRFSYGERDTLFYALSIGMGQDARELPFVLESEGLQVVPTQACVIARAPVLAQSGLNQAKIVHGGQRIELHRPLHPTADLIVNARISDVQDKGEGKGALVTATTDVYLADAPAQLLCTLTSTILARGDGGVGGPARTAAPLPTLPTRAPDHIETFQTAPNQALLYRLNGDRNLLHASPAFAAKVGFPAPILHGLCTYGIACKAIVASVCDYDAAAIASYEARFTSLVYPGERLRTEIWQDGGEIAFRCIVEEREVVVLDHGRCTLR